MKEKYRMWALIGHGARATKLGLVLLGALASVVFTGVTLASEPQVTQTGIADTVTVNQGSLSTPSANVILSIGGKGWAQQMQVSNSPDFAGASWEPYAETKTWTLSDGAGRKKIYVKLSGSNNQQIQLVGKIALDALEKGKQPTENSEDTFTMPQAHTKVPKGAPLPLALAPSYYQTSGFMLGKVAVGIVMPQCNGTRETCTETWNTAAMDQVYSQVTAAMNWWSQRMNGRVTFVIEERRQVPTGYEPIRHPQSDEGLWISEVMSQLGFSGSVYGDQVYAYDNYLRQTYKTDWAFTLFAVNSLNSTTGTFSDGYFAYAYTQGPFGVETYDNGGYGISGMAAVVAHETGHIFGALDEFAGAGSACNSTGGYLMIENQNSQQGCALDQDSIMRGGTTPYSNNLIDPYASGMVGYHVSSANGLPDPINTTPLVTLDPVSSPASNTKLTITGVAQDQPFVPPSGAAYTINNIVNVQYRVDRGAWQNAAPSDGSASFNKVTQGFTFAPALNPGTHLIEVQATNRVNALSGVASATIAVQGPTPTATAPATFTPMPTATAIPTNVPTNTPTRVNTPINTPTNPPTNTPAPSVGGLCVLVYNDLNASATRDSSETRLAGAQIALKNSSNQLVGTYTTDGVNEPHCFTNLPQGQYTLTEINPPGYTSTTPDVIAASVYAGFAFGIEFGDRVSAPAATATAPATFTPMPTATAIPTNVPTNTPTRVNTPTNTPTNPPAPSVGSLCVLVYNDSNGNGVRDSSETRLAGAQIAVKNSSNQVMGTYTTDGVNEPRCFTNLPQGQYTVTEINPPGYTSTTSDVIATSVYAGFAFGLEFGNKLVAPTNTPTRAPTATLTSGAVIDSPSGLKATASSGFVALTWKASRASGVTYTIYRGASSTALTPLTTGITDLAYVDTQVAPGDKFYYYVVASKSGAESKPSNTVRVAAR